MNLSCYAHFFPHDALEGYGILHSALNGATALLSGDVYELLRAGEAPDVELGELIGLRFLVENIEEEKQKAREVLTAQNAANQRLHLIVLANLDCNLGCTYCYEGQEKGRFHMQEGTLEHLIKFALERSADNRQVHIDFFGGEPLLSTALISKTAERLQKELRDREKVFGFSLVTNGTLLSAGIVESLRALGLKGVKITLDGPRDVHDGCRPFKSGAGSFERIVGNLKEIRGRTRIGIGGNFTKGNYRRFPELLDHLLAEGLGPDHVATVKFDPVLRSDKWRMPDVVEACASADEPWLAEASVMLREEILRRGFDTPEVGISSCMVEIEKTYVVNYDGSLYKCPGLIGESAYAIGDLEHGVTEDINPYRPGYWRDRECEDCSYLPLCFGGCRYMKLMRDGTLDSVDCRKEYLDNTLESFVKQDITYRREDT